MHTLNCYLATKDGLPVIIGGTPGGDFQPQCGLQILTNLIDYGMDPQAAVEAPRWWSFPGTDPVLGPEMKSTGEVMGIDKNFDIAFAKSLPGAGMALGRSSVRTGSMRKLYQ